MKNLINYFYNINISDFRRNDKNFYFDVDEDKYMFIPYYGDLNNLYDIYINLYCGGRYCHEIINNKDNMIYTYYKNIPHILLKKARYSNDRITLNEIIEYDIPVYKEKKLNWKDLWKEKIDYYEYQVNQIGFKYKIIRESFSYYIGLSENAINLLNYIDKNKVKNYITHKRINFKEDYDDFLNPLNIIIDTRVRDIAEYIKINYINNEIDIDSVLKFLNNYNMEYNESILLLSRLIYPSYYFDMYDLIIQEIISEDKINEYIKKNTYYEVFLKKIYKFIKLKYKIPEIEWLEG